MAKSIERRTKALFEGLRHTDKYGQEYWTARELCKALGYTEYRNFLPVISRAKDACLNSGLLVDDHFVDFHDMVEIGSMAHREVDNIKLSRYACYLIMQNADPNKEIVALGQTYFAIKTRERELIGEVLTEEELQRLVLRGQVKTHNIGLADAAKQAGVVESKDYAVFQNKGYQGLYGGMTAQDIHDKKGLKKSQHILDHMGSTELAANLFRATQTEEKLRREGIKGKIKANQAHYDVGLKVRKTIEELGGTMPEDLPTEDSIAKLERKQKKIAGKSK